jgi:ribosome silencing factor RsfS/YbeB/iojap
VKKTQRPSGSKVKRSTPEKKRSVAGRKAVERIPVRGATKSKVKRRAAEEAPKPSRSESDLLATRELALAAMEAALDKQALEPVLIDAIAESVSQTMKRRGVYALGREGSGNGRWTLLDFGAFVVHVFYHPVREFYDLESLWIEAPRVKLAVPPESSLGSADTLYGTL